MTLTDASYQSQGAMAPEPVDHVMVRHEHSGTYGERPSPAEVVIECLCGADLWEWTEGYGSTAGTPLDAFEEHLRETDPTTTKGTP